MSSLKTTHPLYIRPHKSPSTDIKDISRNILVDGAEHVLSYGGTCQYSRDGTGASACGLAAMNFARIVFSMEQGGLKDSVLLQAVLARECAEETNAICALSSGDLQLEVGDICRVPLFKKTMKLKTTKYGLPELSEFTSLLTELNNLDSSAVAIITRPPEIIACLKLRLSEKNVFIIFDPHSRPSYPNGAGMIVSTSIEGTARRLTEILPTVDLTDSFLQLQAQLLANYNGHVFVPHGVEMSIPMLWQAMLESSLAQLLMQSEISELRSQNEVLKNEQQRLESEIKEAEARSQLQERLIQRQQQLGSSSRPPKYFNQPLAPTRQSGSSRPSSSKASTSTSTFNSFGPDSPSPGSSSGHVLGLSGCPPTPPSDHDDRLDSITYVMRPQHEFDNKDRALRAQRAELSKYTQRLFMCGICLQEIPNDSVARPDRCGHTFCRECLRGHVATRIGEHRFPVLCPSCTADKDEGMEVAGEVSQALALDLGLTDEQNNIWTEMELVTFSVLLSCRKCQRTMFVARDEHEEATIIVCPLPDCNQAWCKQCQQLVDSNGPMHSCDGTSELDHLMKQEGWKYCPTCKTPIQKRSGCNHMSCVAPACNTHFCYMCGGLIVRSALRKEIKEAASAHFRTSCKLFQNHYK